MELKVLGEKGRKRTMGEGEKERGAEARGLEKTQVISSLIDGEDGSIVVDLPNLGTQPVFILIELWVFYFVLVGWLVGWLVSWLVGCFVFVFPPRLISVGDLPQHEPHHINFFLITILLNQQFVYAMK